MTEFIECITLVGESVDRSLFTPLRANFTDDSFVVDSGEQEPLLLAVASHVSGANLLAYLLTTSVAPYNDKAKLVRCIAAHHVKLLAEGGAHSANLVSLIGKA